jgi:ATP-dependent DNA helicase RecG
MAHKEVARRRLVLDELLRVQLALVQRKRHIERTTRGIAQATDGPLVDAFVARLPFELTADQREAIAAIGRRPGRAPPDAPPAPGRRGAGKTVVAVATLLAAVRAGHQGGVHGADRGAGRAARRRDPGAARRRRGARRGTSLFGAGRCGSSC